MVDVSESSRKRPVGDAIEDRAASRRDGVDWRVVVDHGDGELYDLACGPLDNRILHVVRAARRLA